MYFCTVPCQNFFCLDIDRVKFCGVKPTVSTWDDYH